MEIIIKILYSFFLSGLFFVNINIAMFAAEESKTDPLKLIDLVVILNSMIIYLVIK